MRKTLFVLALISIPVVTLADKGKGAFVPGTYPDKAAAWKRFVVKDIAVGTEATKLAGFTCDDKAGEYRHTCVKFLDEKCKGRPTRAKFIMTLGQVPPGQGCTYNSSSGGTFLDGKSQLLALSSIAVVTTDTEVPRAYEITYRFAKDVLTEESNIGKALIAKYGKPSSTNAPIQMSWTQGSTTVTAECNAHMGDDPANDCMVRVSDTELLDSERSIKQAAEAARALSSGPPAPSL